MLFFNLVGAFKHWSFLYSSLLIKNDGDNNTQHLFLKPVNCIRIKWVQYPHSASTFQTSPFYHLIINSSKF